MKKEEKEKVMYLTEVSEEIMKRDIVKSAELIEDFKGDYKKFMKKLLNKNKVNTQTRFFCVEMLLKGLIHDSNLPIDLMGGLLNRIQNSILYPDNLLTETKEMKKNGGYVSYAG